MNKNTLKALDRYKAMRTLRENGSTYEDIGKAFGVTRQCAHQILSNANLDKALNESVSSERS